jgi:DNA polymerase I-like protein with 3'-5' exonuclease and polymerase domains
LRQAVELVDVKFPKYKEPKIHYIEDLSILDTLSPDLVSIDVETTGLKPHAKGHRIVSCAVATDENTVYAFLMPKKRSLRQPLVNLLTNNLVSKIIANAKYEYTWFLVKLGCEIKNVAFDTMLCSHILDNRPGVTGLKWSTYTEFGVMDYSSEITPYFSSGDNKDGNSINKIEELISTPDGLHKLLTYNAMDSIFTYRLALRQMKIIDYKFLPF